jgi:phasin family protein
MTEKPIPSLTALDPAVIDAFVATNRTAMKGFERLSQYFFESMQQNFDTAVETNKRLAGVKSITELTALQAKLTQEFFDTITERNQAAVELGASIMQDSRLPSAAHATSAAARRGMGLKAAN